MTEAPIHQAARFAELRQITVLLGGMVEARLPSGKPIHGARLFNRAMRRWRMFRPGQRRRLARAR